MAFLNEISATTAQTWLTNFANVQENIYLPFQTNTLLSKKVYEILSNNFMFNIRIYLGLDSENQPKVIAMSTYYLNPGDNQTAGFTDLIVEGKIFELYSDNTISISKAKEFINNWKAYQNNNLFKFGFIIPRPNTIKFFDEDKENNVRLFFGVDENNEIKMMMQKPGGGSGDVVLDYSHSCPSLCPMDTRMII